MTIYYILTDNWRVIKLRLSEQYIEEIYLMQKTMT